jgi:hypothetical protein
MSLNKPLVKFDTNVVSKNCCCYCFHIPTLPLTLSECGHSFCYTCVKEHKIKNPATFKCPLCRRPINDNIAHIKVDNPDKAIGRYIGEPCWLYQTKDCQGWWMYEYYMNSKLEKLYQEDNTKTDNQFMLGVRPYTIDFVNMVQKDNRYQRKRKVHRLDKFEKTSVSDWKIRGIAGVYFEDEK